MNTVIKNLLLAWVVSLSTLNTVIALSSSDINNAYNKSYKYDVMGNVSNAIKALYPVYKEYPKGYAVNLRLAYLYGRSGNYANALANYDTAIVAAPDALEPKLGKMSIYLIQARYSEASELGNKIIAIDYYNYYGNLKLAYALQMENHYDLSEKVLLKMLALYPNDVLYLAQYGALQYQRKNLDVAKSVLNDVLLFDPENITAQSLLKQIKSSAKKT